MKTKFRSFIYLGLPVGVALALLLAFFFALPGSSVIAAPEAPTAIIGLEDFDGGAVNLSSASNVFDFGAGGGSGGDVFGRVDGQLGGTGMPFDVADDTVADVSGARTGSAYPSDTLGLAGQNTTAFFALNDMDGADGPSLTDATWTFDISSASSLTSIQIDIGALGDFEASSSDGFLIEARIDSASYQTIFAAITDESASKTYRPLDGGYIFSGDDPLQLFIDGAATPIGFLDKSDPTTGNFDTYVSTLLAGQSGSTLDIRVSWSGTPSGSEPMGIDNITINGETSPTPPILLLSEVTVTPTGGEFIEIYNPGSQAIDLSNVYLTDATYTGTPSTYYYNIVTGSNAGGGSFGDFHARFPDGASINPGEYQTISLAGSDLFTTTYAVYPTYELFEDGGSPDVIPDMREAFAGSVNGQGGLTNDGEVVILYAWDGLTDLVTDLDYVVWGDKVEAVDKTGVSIDGPDADTTASTYLPDTAISSQDIVDTGSHDFGNTWQREDLSEGTETATGGNGEDGHDETSENLSTTWCEELPSPNLATLCEIDVPPTVSSTTPVSGAAGVALDSNISIGFSENVTVTGGWFDITCASSGAHTAVDSGGPQNFTLNPDADFTANEVCTVTIYAAQVTDQDGTAENMVADYVFNFTTFTPTCGNPATLIHVIQGNGDASPEDGNNHTIEGVVVGDFQAPGGGFNGFFVQEEDTDIDSDPMTSEGIFVYDGFSPAVDVSAGEVVRVTGTVDEYNGLTQLSGISEVEICPAGAVASPATPTLPIANLNNWEWYEGMKVNFTQTLYVTEHFNLGRYGEISLSVDDRLFNPTQVITPGLDANTLQDLNDRSRIQLDDAITSQNPDPIIYPSPELSATNTLRGGDTAIDLTGVLNYAFGAYKIEPVEPITFTHSNPRPMVPDSVGGSLQVASFNVLNYFSTIDTGTDICGPTSNLDCRGADSVSEFTRQRDKIISAIVEMDADIVGLMEIENHATDEAVDDLVNGLNVIAGAGTYAKINTGPIGTDAIKVALIYQPATATPLGSYAVLNNTFDPDYRDDYNRPALAQTFADSYGGRVTVIVNHLKSKGSDCNAISDPDTGDGQGNCNLTRTAAANILLDWLATDPTSSGSPNFLIIGDLNSYAMEDPITALETGGFTDLYRAFNGDDYSYVFDGQWGTLDYSLASTALLSDVTGATAWHINGDEPRVMDYNEEFKSIDQITSLYAPDAYRASDHDPIIVGLELTFEEPTASFISNSPVMLGKVSVFTNTSTGDALLTYLWDFGDSITSTVESPTHIYEAVGAYTVTLTVTNVYGTDVFTNTHTVEPMVWKLLLPLIFRNSGN